MQTKNQIEAQIRASEPFTTVDRLADVLPFSRQTVLNHIDDVIAENDDLTMETVGQAQVFYKKLDRMDELMTDSTKEVINTRHKDGAANYARVVESEDPDFDLVVHWYDHALTEIVGYRPAAEELGAVASSYMDTPVTIKYQVHNNE